MKAQEQIALTIGNLAMQNCSLREQLEVVTARNAELEAQLRDQTNAASEP